MMARQSQSWRSERAAAALAVAVVGCGSTLVGGSFERLDLTIDKPEGAAIVATWDGVDKRDSLDIGVTAALSHHGPEACHVAVYLHASQPDQEDMPTLTDLPAPQTTGELIFEGVLLPPRDGVVFTTEIGEWDAETELFNTPDTIHDIPPESPTTRRWLTIATCAAPDIDVAMEVRLLFSRPSRPRDDGPNETSTAILWH
jgi:hypothetical protein